MKVGEENWTNNQLVCQSLKNQMECSEEKSQKAGMYMHKVILIPNFKIASSRTAAYCCAVLNQAHKPVAIPRVVP